MERAHHHLLHHATPRQFLDPEFKLVTRTRCGRERRIRDFVPVTGSSHCCPGVWIADFRRMRCQRQRPRIATAICVVGLCSAPVRSEEPPVAPHATASKVAVEVVDLTNVERIDHRRKPLRANARLMHAAQVHAEQMARARQLAHVLPNAAYPRAEDRLAAANYRWQTYGENVALGQSGAATAVESWMHSRGHRTNILNPDFTEMGAGYAIDREGRPYYVQVFAGPLS